jgi:hypothetical protein
VREEGTASRVTKEGVRVVGVGVVVGYWDSGRAVELGTGP